MTVENAKLVADNIQIKIGKSVTLKHTRSVVAPDAERVVSLLTAILIIVADNGGYYIVKEIESLVQNKPINVDFDDIEYTFKLK